MADEKQLLELCKYIVDSGQKKGADAIEAYSVYQSELEAEVRQGQINTVNKKIGDQIAIRLYIGKRMGSAFTNLATKEDTDEALDLAIAAAKVTTEDTDWVSLPTPSEYADIKGIWDDSIPNCDPGQAVGIIGQVLSKLTASEPGIIPAFGVGGADFTISAYANSNGVAHSEKASIGYAFVGCVAQTEDSVTPSITSFDIQRGIELDIDAIVNDNLEIIRICKKTVKGKTGKHTVILHPRAYSQLMNYTLVEAIKGDNVARSKSAIADKIGDAVADERVTIYDDGTDPRGMNTSVADGEGVPRQRTPIIEKGVLRSFLWDTYWANKMGLKSTGNARRNTRQGLVEISPSTIVIEPGTRDIQDIIKEIDHGYYIRNVQGAHSSNPESGDFSVVGNPAILIEKGEMVGAVHGLMFSGNMFELLKSIKEISGTVRNQFSYIGPDIAFSNVDVIAKE